MTYNSNFANFEYFYANGTIIPAWIESNSSNIITTWAKLSNTIFPNTGSSSATNTIYLGFVGANNLLSSSGTSGIGEAPQLSCPNPANTTNCSTYAQYDDGTSVFNNYWNFAGNTLPNGWETNVALSYPGAWAKMLTYYEISSTEPQVLDTLMIIGGRALIGIAITNTTTSGPKYSYILNQSINAYGDDGTTWGLYYNTNLIHSVIGVSMPGVESVGYQNGQAIVNYGSGSYNMTAYSQTDLSQNSISYIFLSTDINGVSLNASSNPAFIVNNRLILQISTKDYGNQDNGVQWLRTRAYSPNGVMPSVSFSSVRS